jgi:hypothetical protein
MDYAISIRLTEKQYHVLKNMAHSEYRTMGNMVGALIAEGIHFFLTDRSVSVRKIEEDCVTDHPRCEYYRDEEVIETLTGIALIQ